MREGVTNKGGGLSRCAKGSQTRAGGYRAEERNKQTYKWTSKCTTKGAQRGQNERRSVKTNERKASDRKMSVTKPNERESERTKSEREQNENERAWKRTNEKRASAQRRSFRAHLSLIRGRFERTWVWSEAFSSSLESDQRNCSDFCSSKHVLAFAWAFLLLWRLEPVHYSAP